MPIWNSQRGFISLALPAVRPTRSSQRPFGWASAQHSSGQEQSGHSQCERFDHSLQSVLDEDRASEPTGHQKKIQEYRFKEAQLIIRDNPSLPVEIEPLAGVQFNSSQVVANLLRNLTYMDQETFIILHLDGRLKLSAIKVVSLGTISSSLVHPREVFRTAILSGATAIVAIHNPPLC